MKGRRDILIVHMVNHTPGGLPDLLHRNGFGTRLLHELKEAGQVLKTLQRPIILARCGNDEEGTIQSVKELIKNKALHNYPLIVAGKNADAVEGILESYFETVATLCTPCENGEVLECILFLNHLEKSSKANSGASDAGDEAGISSERGKAGDLEVASVSAPQRAKRGGGALQAPREKGNFSSDIFRQLETQKLDASKLDASSLAGIDSVEQLKVRGYMPQKAQVRAYVEGLVEELNDRSGAHLCRTNFITSNIGEALGLDKTMLENSKAAAFLCAMAVADSDQQELLEVNYLLPDEKNNREELAKHMQTSARLVRDSLGEPLVADVIDTMGQLIGEAKVDIEEDLFFAASLLVASDLVDRVCFRRKCWYPRGAHFIMRKARAGELLDLHPVVLGSVVRFVTEAVGSLPGVFVLPKADAINEAFKARAAAERSYEPETGETKISIVDLSPGMILSRSLYAYDGRLVLESGMRLDRDLIWRIWQLAAIRLLNTPCTVSDKRPPDKSKAEDSGSFEMPPG